VIHFSTDAYAEADRFDAWYEEFGRRVVTADVRRLDAPGTGAFRTVTTNTYLGEVRVGDSARTPIRITRSKRQTADGDDAFTFLLNRRGGMEITQGGATVRVSGAGILMLDHARPLERLDCLAAGGEQRCYGFGVQRRKLLAAAPAAEDALGRPLRQDPRIVGYLTACTDAVFRDPSMAAEPALAKVMGDHVFDLLALLLGPTADAAALARSRGLRAVWLAAILAYCERHLADPELSAATVAARHGISARYVARLMEERGETFGDHVRRKRLAKAQRMLADPTSSRMRISDIAYACGFGDLSHFNRAFKQRFGESPRSFRH